MRFHLSSSFVALVIALASSQQIILLLSHLPKCAQPCITQESAKLGCSLGNLTCSCPQKALLTTLAKPCVVANCTTAELQLTVNITNEVCDIFSSMQSSSLASISYAKTHTTPPISAPTPISLTSALATTTSSQSSSNTPTSSPSPTASSTKEEKKSLSQGAKAGIGIGVAVVGLLILTAVVLCVVGARRRGKDLKHLAWIERRGTVRDRSELGTGEPEMSSVSPAHPMPVPVVSGGRSEGDGEESGLEREDRRGDGDGDGYMGEERRSAENTVSRDQSFRREDGDTLGASTISDIVSPISPIERTRSAGLGGREERSAVI